jgi:hypothetical protein
MDAEGEATGTTGSTTPPPGSGVDSLRLGPEPSRRRHRRLRRVLVTLALAGVAVSAFVVDAHRRDVTADEPSLQAPASAPPATPELPTPAVRTPDAGPYLDAPLALPGAGPWVLFARSESTLYRIDLRTGRVTPTVGASVGANTVVSMVAGPHEVIIADSDSGTEVVVPDGRPAQYRAASPNARHRFFPGTRGLTWVQSLDEGAPGSVVLVDSDNRTRSRPVELGGAWIQSDGAGGLLLNDVGGVYELRGSTPHRLTTGTLTAAGPSHYLFISCDDSHVCGSYLYDRAARTSRRVGPANTISLPTGLLSPDGHLAALIRWQGPNPPVLDVTDLRTGTTRVVPGQFDSRYGGEPATSLAWTPDSRWLITLLDGRIEILDTTTGRVRSSSSAMPTVVQLVLRSP